MPDLLTDFLAAPAEATFRALRDSVLRQPEYDWHSSALDELEALYAAEEFEQIVERLPALMPNWLLSPRVHEILGHAAAECGDDDTAERERYFHRACLRGLAASGDGSAGRPYAITHPADAYDLAAALRREVQSQRLLTQREPMLDVLLCTDGTALHFELAPGFSSPTEAGEPQAEWETEPAGTDTSS